MLSQLYRTDESRYLYQRSHRLVSGELVFEPKSVRLIESVAHNTVFTSFNGGQSISVE